MTVSHLFLLSREKSEQFYPSLYAFGKILATSSVGKGTRNGCREVERKMKKVKEEFCERGRDIKVIKREPKSYCLSNRVY